VIIQRTLLVGALTLVWTASGADVKPTAAGAAEPADAEPPGSPLTDPQADWEATRPETAARNAMFVKFDQDGSGYLTRPEVVRNDRLAARFDEIDLDGDGRVSRTEFSVYESPAIGAEPPPEVAAPSAPAGDESAPAEAAEPAPAAAAAGPDEPAASADGEVAVADAAEPAPANVLQARERVAETAYETVNALEWHTELTADALIGWAVFAGAALDDTFEPGVGMARHASGEAWFLEMSPVPDPQPGERIVLAFRDEDLFQQFRQGALDGPVLERAQAVGDVGAYRVRLGDGVSVRRLADLAPYDFALHARLQRAMVAEPSKTEELVEEGEVYVDEN
jgi:hypothetical protein